LSPARFFRKNLAPSGTVVPAAEAPGTVELLVPACSFCEMEVPTVRVPNICADAWSDSASRPMLRMAN
jgi:hypothetical protein